MPERIDVVEFTDPGCSWAWGTEPKLRLLQWRFGDLLSWRRVLGGLVGNMNNSVDDFDPERAAKFYIKYWRGAYEHTQMTYPTNLKWMYVSTEPAGRAVKAAELQSDDAGGRVLRRLREATFVFGEPPDTTERIMNAVRGVAGLDEQRLADDLTDDLTEKTFHEDWEETRRPNDFVMNLEGDRPGIGRAKHTEGHWRFVFPTVVFRRNGREATVPGWCRYEDYEGAMEAVLQGSTSAPREQPTPQQYFERWPTASRTELDVLCGVGAGAPADVTAYDWGEGLFYMTRDEAGARGL